MPAFCQESGIFDAIYLDRLGLLNPQLSGARDIGLAGTGVAWTEDVQSLTSNPAGLTAISRVEAVVGFNHQANKIGITYFGEYNEFSPVTTSLDAFAVAYPLPTYRGSLVLGAGVFSYQNSVTEALWTGLNAYDGDEERSTFLLEGALKGWVAGFGLSLAPQTDIGISFEYVRGDLDVINSLEYGTPGEEILYRDTYTDLLTIGGWRFHLGLQTRPWRDASFGFRITTPTILTCTGESVYLAEDVVGTDVTVVEDELRRIEEEIHLPYQVSLGFSQGYGPLRLSIAIEHAGWAQTTVNGHRLHDSNMQNALASALNKRLGLELSYPDIPVRLYMGYAQLAAPLRLLDSGEYDAEYYVIPKPVEESREQRLLTGGVGLFMSDNILLEAAISHDIYERRTVPESNGLSDVEQKFDKTRLLMTFSYRF
ncbi:MAG: hypothetical protein GY835_21370 [bacterium]|nr:hypothetical protein [bacterium]